MAKHTPLKGLNQEYPDGRDGFATGNPSGDTFTSSMPLTPAKEASSPSNQGVKVLGNEVKVDASFSTTEASGGESATDGSKNAGTKNNLLHR